MRNASVTFGAVIVCLGMAPAPALADPPLTAFCAAQKALVDAQVGPLVKPVSATDAATGGPKTVGAMVVTLKLGEAPCAFPFGEIALGSGVTPDMKTIFELASVTKVFTTAILALRAKAGDLDVDAPVALHLPPAYRLESREQRVTFQQLATFSGGFHWSDPPDFHSQPYTQKAFVDQVNDLLPVDPIAGRANLPTVNFYSNGSIGLLGQVLMNMDSPRGLMYEFRPMEFSTWIWANLTGPLRMPRTRVDPAGTWATGYAIQHDRYAQVAPFPWVPWGAAGALRSTGADMLRFLEANICAHHAASPACADLPANILAALPLAHAPNDYTPPGSLADPTLYTVDTQTGAQNSAVQAWAWVYTPPPEPNPNNATAIVWKDGGHPGFSSWIGFNPGKAYGIVLLFNTGDVSPKDAGLEVIRLTP